MIDTNGTHIHIATNARVPSAAVAAELLEHKYTNCQSVNLPMMKLMIVLNVICLCMRFILLLCRATPTQRYVIVTVSINSPSMSICHVRTLCAMCMVALNVDKTTSMVNQNMSYAVLTVDLYDAIWYIRYEVWSKCIGMCLCVMHRLNGEIRNTFNISDSDWPKFSAKEQPSNDRHRLSYRIGPTCIWINHFNLAIF